MTIVDHYTLNPLWLSLCHSTYSWYIRYIHYSVTDLLRYLTKIISLQSLMYHIISYCIIDVTHGEISVFFLLKRGPWKFHALCIDSSCKAKISRALVGDINVTTNQQSWDTIMGDLNGYHGIYHGDTAEISWS